MRNVMSFGFVLSVISNVSLVTQGATNVTVYWSDFSSDKILRASVPDGSTEDVIASGLNTPVAIAIDQSGGKLYWADQQTFKIERANLDGSGRQTLYNASPNHPLGIAIDVANGKLYWTEWCDSGCTASAIRRANLDGSAVQSIVTSGLSAPTGIALDVTAGKLYWTDWGSGVIARANTNGSNPETIVTAALNSMPWSLALDAGNAQVYWSEKATGSVRRADLNGSNITTIGSGASGEALALDILSQKVYWITAAPPGASVVVRANLDGSSPQAVLSSLGQPSGAAILSHGTGVPAASTWGVIVLLLGITAGGTLITQHRRPRAVRCCG